MPIMDEQRRKSILKETFDAVSAGYDSEALRFFPLSAGHLATLLSLRGNEQVLDVAAGTGHAALALAPRLPRGRITAVDLSPGMLEQARRKADSQGIRNIDFIERDMQELGFSAGSFDAAVCSFGLFFVEDMDSQLAHIAAMVRQNGQVAISSFQEGYFGPLKDLMAKRLASYGVQMQPQTWKRIASEEGCRELFVQAGLRDVRIVGRNVGYYLQDAQAWWEIIWNAGFRRLVGQLTPSDQERFRKEHVEEIAALVTSKGLWLDVGVFFTVGTKA
jgi:ubiquinone/menaquinone biosynthesis C-methylase UbiE